MEEINNLEVDDLILPDNEEELIYFIQDRVNYNIIRLLESPLFSYTYIVARMSRLERKKSYEGLDLYNVMQELTKTNLAFISQCYNNTLRNSIAHGKYSISSIGNIVYFEFYDKNENIEYEARKLVNLYDTLINIANGLELAFRIFIIRNKFELHELGYFIPTLIAFDEIKTCAELPKWILTGMYEFSRESIRTLSVFVESGFPSKEQNMLQSMITAGIILDHSKEYSSINFNVRSKWTSISSIHYDAKKLDRAIKSNWTNTEKDVITLLFWRSKYRILDYMSKFFNLIEIIQATNRKRIVMNEYSSYGTAIEIINNEYTLRKMHAIVNADCLIPVSDFHELKNYIFENFHSIVDCARKDALGRIHLFSKIKAPSISFIRVYIYIRPVKVRQIRYMRIPLGLMAILEFDKVGNVYPMEIFDNSIKMDLSKDCRVIFDGDNNEK